MYQIKTLLPLLILSLCLLSCNDEELEEQNNQEFIEYNIDEEESILILTDINASFNPNGVNPWTNSSLPILDIFTFQNDYNICFRIQGFLNDSDYFDSYVYNDFENDTGFMLDDFDWVECDDIFDISTNINITFNLSAIGEVGEFIDINFNGSYEDFDGNTRTINGIVHVLRDE